jgi:hypothetical protein
MNFLANDMLASPSCVLSMFFDELFHSLLNVISAPCF